MNILLSYRAIPQSPGWATGDFVYEALKRAGHNVSRYSKVYQKDEWLENPFDLLNKSWDLLIWLECNDGDRQYTELLENTNIENRISWFFDSAMYPTFYKNLIQYFDINYCANLNFVNDCVKFLPYAASLDKHVKSIPVNKDIDFLIIGSDREERRSLYNYLLNNGINIYYETSAFRENYVNMLSKSKVIINDIAGGGARMLPMRPFESLAVGSMLFTPSNQGIETVFGTDCSSIRCYNTYDELLDLCKNYKEDRSAFIEAQKIVLQSHLYDNRIKNILERKDYYV